MSRSIVTLISFAFASAVCTSIAGAAPSTTYVLPSQLHWVTRTPKGGTASFQSAMIRGKYDDACDTIERAKFPDGFVYPWHTNGDTYSIYTVIQGTLVIGFDKHHAKAAEKALPAGSVMQGLGSEPHYGRAIGETIFDIYTPCKR